MGEAKTVSVLSHYGLTFVINYNSFVYCLGCKERGFKERGLSNFMLPKRGLVWEGGGGAQGDR